jgi:hypothetical protein
MTTNRYLKMAMVLAVMAVGCMSFSGVKAQCASGYAVMNAATGSQMNVAGTLDDGGGNGTIDTKFWVMGQPALHNSGSVFSVDQAASTGANGYYIWSDWGRSGVFGECPATADKNVFLYSIQNQGAGQYILLTAPYNAAQMAWDFDAITNGNGPLGPNTETPIAIPSLKYTVLFRSLVSARVAVSWTPIENLKGFYDVEPATNLITGVVIRYLQIPGALSSYKTSTFKVAGVVDFGANGADPGAATVTVPYDPAYNTYIALTLLFDGGQPDGPTETSFVGAPSVLAAATPPPSSDVQFTDVTANSLPQKKLVAKWTATSESTVRAYQVWGSISPRGFLRQITGDILRGDGSYRVKCTTKGIGYVQIHAVMVDGSVTASNTVKVRK